MRKQILFRINESDRKSVLINIISLGILNSCNANEHYLFPFRRWLPAKMVVTDVVPVYLCFIYFTMFPPSLRRIFSRVIKEARQVRTLNDSKSPRRRCLHNRLRLLIKSHSVIFRNECIHVIYSRRY